jgi:hypothetical protein
MKSPYFNALYWRLRMRGKSPGSGGLMGLCGADMDPVCCGYAGLEEDPFLTRLIHHGLAAGPGLVDDHGSAWRVIATG